MSDLTSRTDGGAPQVPFNVNADKTTSKKEEEKSLSPTDTLTRSASSEALSELDEAYSEKPATVKENHSIAKHERTPGSNEDGTLPIEEKVYEYGTSNILDETVSHPKGTEPSTEVEADQTESPLFNGKPFDQLTEEDIDNLSPEDFDAWCEAKAKTEQEIDDAHMNNVELDESDSELDESILESEKEEIDLRQSSDSIEKEEKGVVNDLTVITNSEIENVKNINDNYEAIKAFIKDYFLANELGIGEKLPVDPTDPTSVLKIMNENKHRLVLKDIETGKFKMHHQLKSIIEKTGHFQFKDENNQLKTISRDLIVFAGDEEFEEMIANIQERINALPQPLARATEEHEEEVKNEGSHEERHARPLSHPAAANRKKADASNEAAREKAKMAQQEFVSESTLSTVELNEKRIAEFNAYITVKLEKIRKQWKAEEIRNEEIKRDVLKAEIRKSADAQHEFHVDVANTERAYDEMMQELSSLPKSALSPTLRTHFKEIQQDFVKINTFIPKTTGKRSNPSQNEQTTLSLKKEVIEVGKEIVNTANQRKGGEEDNASQSAGGVA